MLADAMQAAQAELAMQGAPSTVVCYIIYASIICGLFLLARLSRE